MKFRSPKTPHRGLFVKGVSGNPRGRPAGRSPSPNGAVQLAVAAREHCEEALQVIARCMRSDDERIALMAANIMLERGYGKPEQKSDVDVVHRFAVVPEVMEKEQWLATRGDPRLLPPPTPSDADRKLN